MGIVSSLISHLSLDTVFLTECRFFTSPDGSEVWNVYHATAISEGACNGSRYTAVQEVNWNDDGSPNLGVAVALGTELDGPSWE